MATISSQDSACTSMTEALLALDSCRPMAVQCHRGDWSRIVSPLKPDIWEKALESHPNRDFARLICSGIRHGFRVSFNYHTSSCKPAKGNMQSVSQHRDVVEQYIGEEREAGRVLGPFKLSTFPHVQVSPFGVIPKAEPGKWRLILDLSSPNGNSVNDGIAKELCSLSYTTVDDIAASVQRNGRGALMAKFDLKAAYRQVPVHPDDRWLLGMALEDELYIDTTLPFGLRSAPMIFSSLAEALAIIIRNKGVQGLDHYLDDFSLVGPPHSPACQLWLDTSLQVCEELGFSVVPKKTEGPAMQINLLGIEIDSAHMELRLPRQKLEKLQEIVKQWRHRKSCKKRDLQVLAGHLNHACKVIRPGRHFLRGIFGLLSQFGRKDHPIRLNREFRADMEWWHEFASRWNGVSLLREVALQHPSIELWSDASGAWGCGGFWNDKWFQVEWKKWPGFQDATISSKELLPLVIAAAVWGPQWRGSVVRCHCDNQAVVSVIRGGYCKDPPMAHMLRCLFFVEAYFDLTLSATHIPGIQNRAADCISRNNLGEFFSLNPQAQLQPIAVPPGLVNQLVLPKEDNPWTSNNWRVWLESWLTAP